MSTLVLYWSILYISQFYFITSLREILYLLIYYIYLTLIAKSHFYMEIRDVNYII